MKYFYVGMTIFLLLLFALATGLVFVKKSHEFDMARETIRALEASRDFFVTKVAELAEELEVATTPRHREALRLLVSLKEVCSTLPQTTVMARGSDFVCAVSLNKEFPNRKQWLQILRDPEPVIQTARADILEKCALVHEDERPAICPELAGNLPPRP